MYIMQCMILLGKQGDSEQGSLNLLKFWNEYLNRNCALITWWLPTVVSLGKRLRSVGEWILGDYQLNLCFWKNAWWLPTAILERDCTSTGDLNTWWLPTAFWNSEKNTWWLPTVIRPLGILLTLAEEEKILSTSERDTWWPPAAIFGERLLTLLGEKSVL